MPWYELKPDIAKKTYYGTFPRPPLRTLHWEVQKFCEVSFLSCAEYLKTKVKDTGLRRVDDTSVVMQEQGWNVANNTKEINEVDSDCVKIRDKDDAVADPFQGPIERFQWRTTASYYMCWYTMNEVADLRQLNENCDNYANCLDRKTGPKNNDIRANDAEPFMCATYSFCPDPCCPESKHLSNSATCRDGGQNPCYEISPPDRRECSFVRSQNRNFHDIVLNRWNVSCHCPERGFVWSSRYGICIDVDECLVASHDCDNRTEICVNLPGSFECGCRWGYMWSIDANHCVENKALGAIKLERKKEKEQEKTRQAQSLVKRLYTLMVGSRSNVTGSASGRDLCRCTFISHLFLLLFSKLI